MEFHLRLQFYSIPFLVETLSLAFSTHSLLKVPNSRIIPTLTFQFQSPGLKVVDQQQKQKQSRVVYASFSKSHIIKCLNSLQRQNIHIGWHKQHKSTVLANAVTIYLPVTHTRKPCWIILSQTDGFIQYTFCLIINKTCYCKLFVHTACMFTHLVLGTRL